MIFTKCTQAVSQHKKYLHNKALQCIGYFFPPANGPAPVRYSTDCLRMRTECSQVRERRGLSETNVWGATRKGWSCQILKWHISLKVKSFNCSRNSLTVQFSSGFWSLSEIQINKKMLKKVA